MSSAYANTFTDILPILQSQLIIYLWSCTFKKRQTSQDEKAYASSTVYTYRCKRSYVYANAVIAVLVNRTAAGVGYSWRISDAKVNIRESALCIWEQYNHVT